MMGGSFRIPRKFSLRFRSKLTTGAHLLTFVSMILRRWNVEPRNHFVSEPAHIREVSKGNSRRNVNDATNDSVGTDLPIFEPTAPNVTAFVGQTVYLPCRVRKLADKVVSLFIICSLKRLLLKRNIYYVMFSTIRNVAVFKYVSGGH